MKLFRNIILNLLEGILMFVWTILFGTNWDDPKNREDFYNFFKFLKKDGTRK